MGPVVDKWSAMKADVIGVQEMQREQRAAFYSRMKSSYTFFPFDGGVDTDNSILWRQATFGFVQGGTFKVPYFSGNLRNMPWVLLREKATGKTAYFINVHNPATLPDRGDQSQWRAAAIAAERALVTKLKATGVPVFLTGDFNDKEKAVPPHWRRPDGQRIGWRRNSLCAPLPNRH
ncbi:MAG: endonuclease/exonuclease/phosphatase family protein [Marmoricola sp.]